MRNISNISNLGNLSRASGGSSFSPKNITGLTLWLRADAQAYTDAGVTLATNGQTVQQWNDQSGSGFNATQAVGANRPTWNATTGPNSKPAVRFVAATPTSIAFGNVFSGLTGGAEIFFVIKAVADPGISTATGGTTFGNDASGDHYPFTDGTIYDSFASTARKTTGNPTPALTSWRLYNALSIAGEWTSFIDGTQFYTTATNVVGWSATPLLGNGATSASDYTIAEVIMYNKKLSAAEKTQIKTYFANKYALTLT